MSTQIADPDTKLKDLARGDFRTIQAMAQMHERNFEAAGLDEQTYDLVRMAALAALGAPPTSWLAHLSSARRHNIPRERILGTMIAVAPLVGTARTVAAGGSIARALGVAEAVKEKLEEDF